jgi:CheY-like chemotaxis protein
LPEARFSRRAKKFVYGAEDTSVSELPSSEFDIIRLPTQRRSNWNSRNSSSGALVVTSRQRNKCRESRVAFNYTAISGRAVGQASGDRLPRHGLFRATILLVEHEVLVRMSLAEELRNAGYVVLEASNADEALDLLQGHPVRVVLSDIRMPGRLDGVELAHAIRVQHPEIKIVLASAQSFSAGHWSDHDGFFPKPYDARRLLEHIKTLLG